MKTLEQIIEITTARAVSDETAEPPRIAHVEFNRSDLIKALKPRAVESKRATELLAGVRAAGKGTVIIQREHLLQALGVLPGDIDDDDEDENESQPTDGAGDAGGV